jgi:hypothetical protein
MTADRVNIKTGTETRERLRELKRDGETWGGLLIRAAKALEADQEDDRYPAPRCSDCGAKAHAWTVEDGMLVCGSCADGPVETPIESGGGRR